MNHSFKNFNIGENKRTESLQEITPLLVPPHKIFKAHQKIKSYINETPTQYVPKLSEQLDAKIYLKREDLQVSGTYKIRGIYNRLLNLSNEQKEKGVICATSGNQGASLAYACSKLQIKGIIILPEHTPTVKVDHVNKFSGETSKIILKGQNLAQSEQYAQQEAVKNGYSLISFQDDEIIEGCGTVGYEIITQIKDQIDVVIYSLASGSLAAGMGSYVKQLSPETTQIGVQYDKGDSQTDNSKSNFMVSLVDSEQSAMNDSKIQNKHQQVLSKILDGLYDIPNGLACTYVTHLFDKEKIIVEPPVAVSCASMELFKDFLKGKTVVCVLCGSFRNDISRLTEIRIQSDVYQGKLYYLLINFFSKSGALKQFILECLGENDQVCQIEYTRKNNRAKGPALVGIESPNQESFQKILKELDSRRIDYTLIDSKHEIFKLKV